MLGGGGDSFGAAGWKRVGVSAQAATKWGICL
jgi:hypothetical protein